jgi:predicted site-specific integrase-resolvase
MYIDEALKVLGISYNTLKSWAKQGRIRRVKEDGGRWIYNDSDVYAQIGKQLAKDHWVVTYSRVPGTTESDRELMTQQRLRLQDWCTARGLTPDQAYEDWAPSTEYSLEQRPGLHLLLQDVIQGRVSAVVADTPDRITRVGVEIFSEIFRYYGVELIYLNRTISRPEYLAEQESDLLRLLKRAKVERLDRLGAETRAVPKKPKLKDPGKIVPNWEGAPLPPSSRDLSDLM